MKILVTGGSGFVGQALCVELFKKGHALTLVTRPDSSAPSSLPLESLVWDMERSDCPISLDRFDAIIHLAGESIAGGRWTAKRKSRIRDSRIKTTESLGRALKKRTRPLDVFVSASAVGIYPDHLEAVYDEAGPTGQDFLAEVCRDWEGAVDALPQVERRLKLRFGLVLGPDGGILPQMARPTRFGLGAVLGTGQQWLSWIHRDDLVRVILQALEDGRMAGVLNLVSPGAVRQEAFQKELADVLGRPQLFKVPAPLIQAALGEMSALLLGSQHAVPKKLLELGFKFRFPELRSALEDALGIVMIKGKALPTRRLQASQFVPKPVNEVFQFFSDPYQLENITPPLLKFHITHVSRPDVQEGTEIHYKMSLRGLPMRWKTLITEWKAGEHFVDVQESGPYAYWHHTHEFFPVPGGTLMTDLVRYRLPLGGLGDTVAQSWVRRDLRQIFAFRRKTIASAFGGAK